MRRRARSAGTTDLSRAIIDAEPILLATEAPTAKAATTPLSDPGAVSTRCAGRPPARFRVSSIVSGQTDLRHAVARHAASGRCPLTPAPRWGHDRGTFSAAKRRSSEERRPTHCHDLKDTSTSRVALLGVLSAVLSALVVRPVSSYQGFIFKSTATAQTGNARRRGATRSRPPAAPITGDGRRPRRLHRVHLDRARFRPDVPAARQSCGQGGALRTGTLPGLCR